MSLLTIINLTSSHLKWVWWRTIQPFLLLFDFFFSPYEKLVSRPAQILVLLAVVHRETGKGRRGYRKKWPRLLWWWWLAGEEGQPGLCCCWLDSENIFHLILAPPLVLCLVLLGSLNNNIRTAVLLSRLLYTWHTVKVSSSHHFLEAIVVGGSDWPAVSTRP